VQDGETPPAGRVIRIVERLLEWYRDEPWWRQPNVDPFHVMLAITLSNRSNYRSVRCVVEKLAEHYPDPWSILRDPEGVKEMIRPLGLVELKTRVVLGLARLVAEAGSVEALLSLPPSKTREKLLSIPGIGEKTADVLLMALWGTDVFPVDTHIARIAARLGLVEPGTRPERVRKMLEPLIPKGFRARTHLAMIRLGRDVCRPRNPRCSICPLYSLCPSANSCSPCY